jgi:hypothetical protein
MACYSMHSVTYIYRISYRLSSYILCYCNGHGTSVVHNTTTTNNNNNNNTCIFRSLYVAHTVTTACSSPPCRSLDKRFHAVYQFILCSCSLKPPALIVNLLTWLAVNWCTVKKFFYTSSGKNLTNINLELIYPVHDTEFGHEDDNVIKMVIFCKLLFNVTCLRTAVRQ